MYVMSEDKNVGNVCMYVCMYVCINMYMYENICICMCICICVYVYVDVDVDVDVDLCMHVRMYVCMYVYVYVCTRAHIHIYIYICVYIYVHIYIYTYIYVCIHIDIGIGIGIGICMYMCVCVYMLMMIQGAGSKRNNLPLHYVPLISCSCAATCRAVPYGLLLPINLISPSSGKSGATGSKAFVWGLVSTAELIVPVSGGQRLDFPTCRVANDICRAPLKLAGRVGGAVWQHAIKSRRTITFIGRSIYTHHRDLGCVGYEVSGSGF